MDGRDFVVARVLHLQPDHVQSLPDGVVRRGDLFRTGGELGEDRALYDDSLATPAARHFSRSVSTALHLGALPVGETLGRQRAGSAVVQFSSDDLGGIFLLVGLLAVPVGREFFRENLGGDICATGLRHELLISLLEAGCARDAHSGFIAEIGRAHV